MIAPDPFNTNPLTTSPGKKTYNTIAARLAAFDPPIIIKNHIAQRKAINEDGGTLFFSTLVAKDSTLDGIDFIVEDAHQLDSAFENAKEKWGKKALASMDEDPKHWALKASFMVTPGKGWREKWVPIPDAYNRQITDPTTDSIDMDKTLRMRFGTGTSIRFTALHCAIDTISAKCNIHIDNAGFVLSLPDGFSLTPDLYAHFMNELLSKTNFRDWLSGLMPNETAARIVKEVFRRTSLIYPNAANNYAGVHTIINGIHRPNSVLDGLQTAARIFRPIGVTFDMYGTDGDRLNVQVTGMSYNDNNSITITLNGIW